MYKNYNKVKTCFAIIPKRSLEDVAKEFKSGIAVKKNVVSALKEIRVVAESVRGRADDREVGERLRSTGMLLIAIPEPFQLTSIAGVALCGAGLVLKNIESKMLGMKDVVSVYRRIMLELKQLLKE